MSALITLSIGARSAENHTVNSVVQTGNDFALSLSGNPTAAVKTGDKFTDVNGVSFRIVAKGTNSITVRKYFGTTHTGQGTPAAGAGTSVRAYADPSAWEAGKEADLTTPSVEGQTGVLWEGQAYYSDNNALFSITANVSFAGSTTSTTCYPWLHPAPNEGWIDYVLGGSTLNGSIAGAGIRPTNNSSIGYYTTENYTLIEGMRWNQTNSYVGAPMRLLGDYGTARNNFLHRSLAATSGALVALSGIDNVFVNNYVVDASTVSASGQYCIELGGNSGEYSYVLHNLFLRCSDTGGDGARSGTFCRRSAGHANAQHVIRGNIILGWLNYYSNAATTGTLNAADSGYNLTDLAEGTVVGTDLLPGSGNLYGGDIPGGASAWRTAGVILVNPATGGDWSTDSGSICVNAAPAYSGGPTHPYGLPTDSGGAFVEVMPVQRTATGNVDALNRARGATHWIGPWEIASGGPPLALFRNYYHRRQVN